MLQNGIPTAGVGIAAAVQKDEDKKPCSQSTARHEKSC